MLLIRRACPWLPAAAGWRRFALKTQPQSNLGHSCPPINLMEW
jgi:hypothetical protein